LSRLCKFILIRFSYQLILKKETEKKIFKDFRGIKRRRLLSKIKMVKKESYRQQRNNIFWVDSNRDPVSFVETFSNNKWSLLFSINQQFLKAIKSNNICPHYFTKPNDFKVTNLQKIKQKNNKSKSVTSEKTNDAFSSQIVIYELQLM
jgi:hypothetical protein